jgi:DNA-binding winged helix-turn-helix (wHTH) protein
VLRLDFGTCSFDPARRLLVREGRDVHLTRKAFLLLELLMARRPAVVTKEEILDRLWPDCFVHEGSVATLISEIRAALAGEGSAIRTVHGVGYAFAAEARAGVAAPATRSPRGDRALLIEKGPPPRVLDLRDGDTVIGRGLDCDLRLGSASVSRTHARISLRAGVARIEDLGSHNGTYLRGVRLDGSTGGVLASGDEIRVGQVELVFRVDAAAESETESLV